jgi:high-affinity K+ transport system ATPase subunit B
VNALYLVTGVITMGLLVYLVLTLRGVPYQGLGAAGLLRDSLLIYGLGRPLAEPVGTIERQALGHHFRHKTSAGGV